MVVVVVGFILDSIVEIFRAVSGGTNSVGFDVCFNALFVMGAIVVVGSKSLFTIFGWTAGCTIGCCVTGTTSGTTKSDRVVAAVVAGVGVVGRVVVVTAAVVTTTFVSLTSVTTGSTRVHKSSTYMEF